MSTYWTEEEESLLQGLFTKPAAYIHDQFHKRLGKEDGFETYRSPESIARKLRRLKGVDSPEELREVLDDRWKSLEALWESYKEDEVLCYAPNDGNDRMILSLSDLHLPFTPIDRVRKVLETHKRELREKEGYIVLNGDIMDQYAASSFGKYKKIALLDEYKMSLDLVDLCLDYSDYVAMTRGNHEKRLNRLMGDHIENEAQVFNNDLLAHLANGEELDDYGMASGFRKHFKGRVLYQRKEPWYIRVGKTIFAHPSAFKSGVAGTPVALHDYFLTRYTSEEFDSIVCPHTHKQSKVIHSNKLLIEQGAMCGRVGYEHQDNLKFRHSTNGYAVIYQSRKGDTNFNESRFIYLGSMLPGKKPLIF